MQNGYRFRSICERDREAFMELALEWHGHTEAGNATGDFTDRLWREHLLARDMVYMMVYREPGEEPVAMGAFQETDRETVYLGYIVSRPLRGKQIGTEVVRNLAALAHSTFPDKRIGVRIRKENAASRRVTEKCGGRLIGVEDAPEIKVYQDFVDKHEKTTDLDLDPIREAIENGRNSVLVYEV